MKKQKDLDILRRFILYPRRPRKEYQPVRYERTAGQPMVQEILEERAGEEKQVEGVKEGELVIEVEHKAE